jgi:SAM-dependent methyltransferase
MDVKDPTTRFSDRVESYVRARPGYPAAVLDAIEADTGLTAPLSVADVGSGPGIFTRLLLEKGHTVYAVEPNAPMRQAAEKASGDVPRFHSVDGRAEATTLPDGSVDLVTTAQAFHWFDIDLTRQEWRRILRPPHWAALLWNDRRSDDEGFGSAYEAFLREWGGAEYLRVRGSWDVGGSLDRFFGPRGRREQTLANAQRLDREALEGRLLSSSYLPGPDDPRHVAMLEAARGLFEKYQAGGAVTLAYDVRVYVGRM